MLARADEEAGVFDRQFLQHLGLGTLEVGGLEIGSGGAQQRDVVGIGQPVNQLDIGFGAKEGGQEAVEIGALGGDVGRLVVFHGRMIGPPSGRWEGQGAKKGGPGKAPGPTKRRGG